MSDWAELFLWIWCALIGWLLAKLGVAWWRYRKKLDDDDDENEMGV